jgi:hypothetical protein
VGAGRRFTVLGGEAAARANRKTYCTNRLWADDYGGVEPFLIAFGVGLNGVEGDVLVFLRVSLVFLGVIKGAVGFQDVVDSVTERRGKDGTVAFENISPLLNFPLIPANSFSEMLLFAKSSSVSSMINPHTKLPAGTVNGLLDVDDACGA